MIKSYSTSSSEITYKSLDDLIRNIEEWFEEEGSVEIQLTLSSDYLTLDYIHEEDDMDSVEVIHLSYLSEADIERIKAVTS